LCADATGVGAESSTTGEVRGRRNSHTNTAIVHTQARIVSTTVTGVHPISDARPVIATAGTNDHRRTRMATMSVPRSNWVIGLNG
jgi:ABC-type Fe2+-enterobactin transport system substrate-binding protein